MILIAADLANGSKHFAADPKREWTGARDAHTVLRRNSDGTWAFDPYVVLDDASYLRAVDVADGAMKEWQEILRRHGLQSFSDGPAA